MAPATVNRAGNAAVAPADELLYTPTCEVVARTTGLLNVMIGPDVGPLWTDRTSAPGTADPLGPFPLRVRGVPAANV